MSKDKYPSIFSPQMATIVFIILQIFFATRADLKIGEYLRWLYRSRTSFMLRFVKTSFIEGNGYET